MAVLVMALDHCLDWEQGQVSGLDLAAELGWDPVLVALSAELLAEQVAMVGLETGLAQGQGLAPVEELAMAAEQSAPDLDHPAVAG